MSFRALKTFVELKIFYFVDPIDSIQYIEISYFLHVSYSFGRTKYGKGNRWSPAQNSLTIILIRCNPILAIALITIPHINQ